MSYSYWSELFGPGNRRNSQEVPDNEKQLLRKLIQQAAQAGTLPRADTAPPPAVITQQASQANTPSRAYTASPPPQAYTSPQATTPTPPAVITQQRPQAGTSPRADTASPAQDKQLNQTGQDMLLSPVPLGASLQIIQHALVASILI